MTQPAPSPGSRQARPALTKDAVNVPREAVISSFIDSIGYDGDRKWLALAFKSGLMYIYAGVPREVYLALLQSESKGRYYNQYIRHHFAVAEAGLTPGRPELRSTAIRAVGYQTEGQLLEVEFGSGQVYRYREVPATVFEALTKAPSRGGYFNSYIRDLYELEEEEDDAAADLDFLPSVV
jgi:hypothetical protein